ncbi:MAG: hypothetical protein WBA46_18750 [Thermomicrobiales bacterium]
MPTSQSRLNPEDTRQQTGPRTEVEVAPPGGGTDAGPPRAGASTDPEPAQPTPSPGDPNYKGGRRFLETQVGMFLPAVVLLLIGIAVIIYIAW